MHNDDEMEEGKILIEEKIRDIFSKNGKNVTQIKWQPGKNETHTIIVACGAKQATITGIPDERIQDYPGGVGNEAINGNLNALLSQI